MSLKKNKNTDKEKKHISTPLTYKYNIARIRTLSFLVDEMLFAQNEGKQIGFQLAHEIFVNGEKEIIDFKITAQLHFVENEEMIAAKITVQNVFDLQNISQYQVENKYILPTTFLLSILSVSISHARALFSSNLAGTFLQEYILPITNPIEVAKRFYPNIFSSDGETLQERIELIPPISKESELKTD